MQYVTQPITNWVEARPQLFKGWITLSTGYITIQWINVNKTNHAICWIVIYPVDSIIQPLNNPGQMKNAPEGIANLVREWKK